MRTGLKWLLIAATCALGAVAAAGALFIARPQTLLTDRTVAAALKHFGAGWSPRWSRLEFSAEALESRRHRYAFSAADLCVADQKGLAAGCFSELQLSLVVFYSRRGPIIERLERVVAASEGPRVDLRRRDPAGGALRRVVAALRSTPVSMARIELRHLTVTSSTTVVSGDARALLMPGRPISFRFDLLARGPEGQRRLKGELTATNLLRGDAPAYVDVAASADLWEGARFKAAFRVRREVPLYIGSGTAEMIASTGAVRGLRLSACKASGSRDGGALSCRFELVTTKAKAVTGRVALNARVDDERLKAALDAEIDPISAWYELTGRLALRASARLDRPLKDAVVRHEIHATAKAQRFQDLVALLRDTKYAVPSPIHVLKGPLRLDLDGEGDSRANRQTARYAFSSDLAGKRQRLTLRADGQVTVVDAWTQERSYEHEGTLILKKVALELPRLGLERAPKVAFDRRITVGQAQVKAAPAAKGLSDSTKGALLPVPARLRSRLVVRTEKPLILFSNLAKDPVPVGLEMSVSYPPTGVEGKASVGTFNVSLFRRDATVDHLNVRLSSGSKAAVLEGLVLYKTPAATISIHVLGTTEKPRIEFSSVPPMKKEDIIAMLIFGKDPSELDLEQTASVGNTETALESRAFGLASLYLFGATPIEHVGYDSATKTASVKLRLPGGADLSLDSDFDQSRELRLRKSLAPHWAIESEITDQGQDGGAATTFLEWFNRY